MAATIEETPVSYEELADLEHEFDEVETEISESSLAPPQA
jgi:hypothetical protein